jgi:polyketide synthase 12/epothilone polyketide synthase D
MGRRLQEEPAFARRLRECDAALRDPAGFSVLETLNRHAEDACWRRVEVIQPLLFALQVALSAQWIAWGVEPDAVIGHSLGEVAASVVAGSLSLEDGAHVIGTRSRLVARTCGRGRMALIELGWTEIERELSPYPGVSIASHHGPETVLVSGHGEAVERMVGALQARGVFARLVDVDYASHSAQMDGLLGELGSALRGVSPRRGQRAQCSTLLADLIGGEELGAEYWVRNLREPVRFHEAVEKLIALGHDLFVEVSPHPVLTPTLERTLGTRGSAFGSVRRGGDEVRELSEALARVYVSGAEIDWSRRYADSGAQMVRLPAYAWSRSRYWMERAGKPATIEAARGGHGWLAQSYVSAADPGTQVWQGALEGAEPSHLQEHRVQGTLVVAGAVWLEAALHGARQRGAAPELLDVEFVEMLALDAARPVTVQVLVDDSSFDVLSAPSPKSDAWTRHARGRLARAKEPSDSAQPDRTRGAEELAAARERCRTPVDRARFYEQARACGIEYGERYAGLAELWLGEDEAVAELSATRTELGRWEIEPWSLDACLQVLGATRPGTALETFLPVRLERLCIEGRFRDRGWVHARRRRTGPDTLEGDVRLYDADGRVLVEASGIRLQRVGRRRDELEDWLFTLEWQNAALPRRDGTAAPGTWLILSDGTLGRRVARGLEAAGARCIGISCGESDGFERALADALDCRGVLVLWPAEGDEEPPSIASSLRVFGLVQALARLAGREAPRLWLVTRATQAVVETDVVQPLHAPLWGLSRTLVHEHPELRPTCIDLPEPCGEASLEALVRELISEESGEDQIALRAEGRFVARLLRADFDSPAAEPSAPAGDRAYALETRRPGTLESLSLREAARREPGPGEIEIEVQAAGLNLLDVLLALGALPDDAPGAGAQGPRLGGECAGRVVRVGPSVTRFAVGDRVLALAPAAFRSFAVAPERFAALLPTELSYEAGAGFPIAFLTAHLALRSAARLEKNERVLIHAAATGVGLAAVQIALQIGAEVFATAGSPEKRERLRALGVRHVLDSRSLEFAEGVMSATGGEGVDVVLNSLSGEFIPKSLGVLREHGRYVEIGKRDYYQDKKLGLRPFLKGLTLALVDLRAMLHTRPKLVERALEELAFELGTGRLTPLPLEAFPVRSAAGAFSHVAQAKHIGKVVLTFADRTVPVAAAERTFEVRADGSYLITGGLGGLGLEVTRHLVSRGARRIVLMGRRAPTVAAEAVIAELRRTATILVVTGDVAREEDVARALDVANGAATPLRGVVHAAAVLDDGVLVQQSAERFAAVMAPKVTGAWNLHVATERVSLDFFVLFSSIASLLGAPAQASYAAGNAFLDALAQHRRARGLPTLSINWGAWGEVGLAAAQDNRARRVQGQGLQSLSTEQGIRAFSGLLASPRAQIGVAALNFRQWFQSHPLTTQWPVLSALVNEANAAPAVRHTRFKEALHAARADARRRMLHEHLAEQVASVLRIAPERVESSTTLASLGMDSLTALEFRNRLEQSLGLALRATLIWAHPTIAGLAEFIAKQLGLELAVASEREPEPAAASPEAAIARDIESMSDVEAEAALRSVLDAMGTAE